jgi:type IV pilus assembly protein PilE
MNDRVLRSSFASPNARVTGFTLIEVMIVVVIVGILAAIALPAYFSFITRARITEATTKLSDLRTQMEKYFMDNRTYLDVGGGGKCGVDVAPINAFANYNGDANRRFDVSCGGPQTATTYTLTATGIGAMAGFVYTIDQNNVKASVGPAGWTAAPTCWLLRKDGSCS